MHIREVISPEERRNDNYACQRYSWRESPQEIRDAFDYDHAIREGNQGHALTCHILSRVYHWTSAVARHGSC